MNKLKLICVLFALFFAILVHAEEIHLYKGKGKLDEKGPDRRTIVWEPTAAIDGTNIILYSDVTMEMSVCIYDANNILVQTLSLTCMGETDFDLLLTSPGEYRIEISCGEDFYYGYFVLE